MSKIVGAYDAETYDLICANCPLRISAYPVETISRLSRKRKILTEKVLRHHTETRLNKERRIRETPIPAHIIQEEYYLSFLCGGEVKESVLIDSMITCHHVSLARSRRDHQFRLHGEVSTTFTKIYQILVKEQCIIKCSVICLAEGEGSLARLLCILGAETVYYNSLVDTSSLVAQRALGFVPACMSDRPELVRWGDLCALSGGDLTNPNILQMLLDHAPMGEVSIVTCDAETVHDRSPYKACRIINAWLILCIKVQTKYALVKTFCADATQLPQICGAIKIVFTNVRIIVPTFSSHKTHEVYIYCSKRG
jgi:mRNA capping enzyme